MLNIPLRDYLAQRDALLKKDEDQKRENLIKAQENINETIDKLHYGRGNVITDLEETHFLTAARVGFNHELYRIFNSDDLYKNYQQLAECLPNDDQMEQIEKSSIDEDDCAKKTTLIISAAIGLCLKSGNCNEQAALSLLFCASKLDE